MKNFKLLVIGLAIVSMSGLVSCGSSDKENAQKAKEMLKEMNIDDASINDAIDAAAAEEATAEVDTTVKAEATEEATTEETAEEAAH